MATAAPTIDIFDAPPESRGRPRTALDDAYANALMEAVNKLEGKSLANATGEKPFKTKVDARKRGDAVKRDLTRRGTPVAVRIWENQKDSWVVGVKRAPVKDDESADDE